MKKILLPILLWRSFSFGQTGLWMDVSLAKKWNKNIITIVGGVHATLNPEDFADVAVDVIGIGDGTFLLAEIVDAIDKKQDILKIPGVAIPVNEGKIFQSNQRPYMPKADTLPLPRRDLVKHLQHKYYYLMHQYYLHQSKFHL